MDEQQRNKVRQKILKEIERFQQDIAALEELVKPISPDNAVGRLSRMEALNTKSVNEATLSAAKIKLTKLKRALLRIDDSDFGLCRECGQPIPMGRILLMPETSMCVPCLEELQK